jgi:signal transduction histidine kinase/heme-degrading monooxygenase HmoA
VILAMSRFKVANGMEDAVADAFANRPGLVDGWLGFLGMETFTDTADPSVFHLATRWTDRAAFQAWHHSAVHRASHHGMPKGLRLNPAYTELVELERLPRAGTLDTALVLDTSAALATYLTRTRVVHLVRCDVRGDIQFVNAAMADRLGLAAGVACGRSVFSCLVEHDADVLRQRLDERSGKSSTLTLNFCDAAGSPFTLSSQVTSYLDGSMIIGEAIVEDEARLQHQLMEVNAELAALARTRQRSTATEQRARHHAETESRAKDDGLAVIAHELRQPLHAMLSALSVTKQNPTSERGLRVLERQVGYMTTLVEELLHASQVMRGTVTLTLETTNLGPFVREVAEAMDAGVRERGQQLLFHIPDEPSVVRLDKGRMRQVLTNVLANAMKYTPNGGSIIVVVEATDGDVCRVRVRDTGQGLAADALDRVFDLFARATSGGNGLGIGLAVAKRLVELHHGTIAVTSEGLGRGSEFVVTLPVALDVVAGDGARPSGRVVSQ